MSENINDNDFFPSIGTNQIFQLQITGRNDIFDSGYSEV